MKTIKSKFTLAAALVLGSVAALAWHPWERKQAVAPQQTAAVAAVSGEKRLAVQEPAPSAAQALPPPSEASPSPAPLSSPASSAPQTPALPASVAKAKAPAAKPNQKSGPKPPKPPILDPLAREALSYVGADPLADAYWASAINDQSLPPDERRELIEDLNQDGFPDRRNLTRDDVPLIVNRLQLIEDLAPNSMDQVNSAAFQEAYKDLVNMLARTP